MCSFIFFSEDFSISRFYLYFSLTFGIIFFFVNYSLTINNEYAKRFLNFIPTAFLQKSVNVALYLYTDQRYYYYFFSYIMVIIIHNILRVKLFFDNTAALLVLFVPIFFFFFLLRLYISLGINVCRNLKGINDNILLIGHGLDPSENHPNTQYSSNSKKDPITLDLEKHKFQQHSGMTVHEAAMYDLQKKNYRLNRVTLSVGLVSAALAGVFAYQKFNSEIDSIKQQLEHKKETENERLQYEKKLADERHLQMQRQNEEFHQGRMKLQDQEAVKNGFVRREDYNLKWPSEKK